MANIQDNKDADGFIGLAYVSQDQGEKESRVQTFDSISWASRAVIDGFTDERVTQTSQVLEGDFESGDNPGAGDSNWINDNSPDTSEVVASYEGKTNVLHLKESSASLAGVKSKAQVIDHNITYDMEVLVYVKEAGTGTLTNNVTFFWNTGSSSLPLDETDLAVGKWIKLVRTNLATANSSLSHINIKVANGAEIYVDYARARSHNRLILKDLRGIGNGISPNGSGLSTTYSYKSTAFKTHPVPDSPSGTYINKAVVQADFVREGLSHVVIKTNFHNQKTPGGASKDYTWYDSANGIDRLNQEISTSGTSAPWLSASGQYVQVQIDVITDSAGNGATINSFGCYTDPALYTDE